MRVYFSTCLPCGLAWLGRMYTMQAVCCWLLEWSKMLLALWTVKPVTQVAQRLLILWNVLNASWVHNSGKAFQGGRGQIGKFETKLGQSCDIIKNYLYSFEVQGGECPPSPLNESLVSTVTCLSSLYCNRDKLWCLTIFSHPLVLCGQGNLLLYFLACSINLYYCCHY